MTRIITCMNIQFIFIFYFIFNVINMKEKERKKKKNIVFLSLLIDVCSVCIFWLN